MAEPRDVMEKRLQMRSMRRGIKEMDLILSAFAQTNLGGLSDADLTLYDQLLEESDHDIYAWVNGQFVAPDPYKPLISMISAGAHGVTRPN